MPGYRLDEAVQQRAVGGYLGAAPLGPGEPVPGEVERVQPATAGEQRRYRRPVHGRPAQPVYADDHRAAVGTAEVEVVHRTIDVDPARTIIQVGHLPTLRRRAAHRSSRPN